MIPGRPRPVVETTTSSPSRVGSSERGFTRAGNKTNDVSTVSISSTGPGCLICGRRSCGIVTHRLAVLDTQRRSTNTKPKRGLKPSRVSTRSFRPTNPDLKPLTPSRRSDDDDDDEEESRPALPVPTISRPVTSFTPFPVKGASRHIINQFYDFFANQGSTIYDTSRTLTFDSLNYPHLIPKALQNAALCMSCVGMSATYQSIHGRNLPASALNTLTVHSQTFQLLREQIDSEADSGTALSEATIQTCLNLIMSCGIAMGDPKTAILHWKGCLALFRRRNVSMYSGHMLMLVAQMDFWLSIIAGCKPRSEVSWISPVSFPSVSSLTYGSAFSRLFAHPLLIRSEVAGRLHETCLVTCAVTQNLEEHVSKHPNKKNGSDVRVPLGTYFEYLRHILMTQNTILCSDLEGSDTFEECIALSLSLFFVIVMRRTPWKHPLLHLCRRIRECLETSLCCTNMSHECQQLPISLLNTKITDPILLDCYTWLTSIHAFASHMCDDQAGEEWSHAALTTLLARPDHDMTESRLFRILNISRRFCWSNTFLSLGSMGFCNTYGII